jgi:hypothetical protein
LLNKIEGNFSENDVEKARSIASAVAIAVSNALTYQEVSARQQALTRTLTEKQERLAAATSPLTTEIFAIKEGLMNLFDQATLTSKQRGILQELHQRIYTISDKLDIILNETNPRPKQPPLPIEE